MDRALLLASTLCFLAGFGVAMFLLGGGKWRATWLQSGVLAAGFALQTGFLWVRGQQIGRCPLTNLFEVLVFLAWAAVLFYWAVGAAYRLSLLGAFTAPLAFVLQAAALMSPLDHPPVARGTVNPWLELHASFSLLAYGALVLAGVAGTMYRLQERRLKTHQLGATFFQFPPIQTLGETNTRLLLLGFALLTVGMAAGFKVGVSPSPFKMGWSVGVWLLYGGIVVARFISHLSPRRVAGLSAAAACLAIATLWGITFIAEKPQRKLQDSSSKLQGRPERLKGEGSQRIVLAAFRPLPFLLPSLKPGA